MAMKNSKHQHPTSREIPITKTNADAGKISMGKDLVAPRVYELMPGILEKIWLERLRQKQLLRDGKILFTCDSPIVGPDRKLRVLAERVGEVARAVEQMEFAALHGKTSPQFSAKSARAKHDLRNELTQLTAAGIAWLESLEGK
jgi:hypothetical protein